MKLFLRFVILLAATFIVVILPVTAAERMVIVEYFTNTS